MEISGQVWGVLAFFAAWVISVIAHGLLMYRAFLHSRPSVTMHRLAWSQWLFLRREEFTTIGWRYRQAAVACLAFPLLAFFAVSAIWML